MNRFRMFTVLLLVALLFSACSRVPVTGAEPTAEGVAQGAGISDRESLAQALEAAGVTVETGGPIEQVFFSVPGQILRVNGVDVQVFEYETVADLEAEVRQVAPDGGSIGTTMVNWVDAPHFYRIGRLIVLYVGSDPAVLQALNATLGGQFAGR